MWQEFVSLFTDFGYIPMIILALGLILCIIELFVPGFGVFGILGSIFVIGSVIARMMMGGTGYQLVIMIITVMIILALAVLGLVAMSKLKWIHSPFIEKQTTLPTNYHKEIENLQMLVGKSGVAITNLSPIGHALIDNVDYEVLGDEYISANTYIKVVKVEDKNIYVTKDNR